MEIIINGKKADITLDKEKTLGNVLSGLDLYISSSGSRIEELYVDGLKIDSDKLESVFDNDIKDIQKLEVSIRPWRDLAIEAMGELLVICRDFEKASFQERNDLKSTWEESAAGRFVASDIVDFNNLIKSSFQGEISMGNLITITEERLRELIDPVKEILNSELLVKNVKERLEELPLDIQTGKDQRAADTVQLFSQIGEKLFRIYFIYKTEGLPMDDFPVNDKTAQVFIEDFKVSLNELSSAYASQDTVLAGDVAEYELAPMLWDFFLSIKEFSNLHSSIITKV